MVKDFYGSPSFPPICPELFYQKYLGKGVEFEPSPSMLCGLVLESKLIGKSRGGASYAFPTLKNGERSKQEQDIDVLVEQAKKVFDVLKLQPLEVQPVWEANFDGISLIGHPDLIAKSALAKKAIFDIKYCGFANDRFSPYADEAKIDQTQPLMYTFMHYLIYGEWIPFYYIILFKSGEIKIIDVKVTVQGLDSFKVMLQDFQKEIISLNLDSIEGDYNQCVRCQLNTGCVKRVMVPRLEELVV